MYFEIFVNFVAKEIGLNGFGRIWTSWETYFESFDIFVAEEIGLNGHGWI